MTAPATSIPRFDRRDAAIAVLLAVGTVAYLMAMPRNLGASDEGYYLYHAVRVLRGEVLYRDISELITPLYIDLMTVVFRTFGADMAVARAAAAVVQAGIVVLVYLGCRAAGVGRALAAAAPLPYLAVGHAAWPFATPHWLGALLVSALLLIGLDRERARSPGWVAGQGLLLGLMLANRQPTGVVMFATVAVLLVGDRLADLRWATRPGAPVVRPGAVLAATALAEFAVILTPHLILAGGGPLFQQLVVHPLTGYRAVNQITWGEVGFAIKLARYTYPRLLAWFSPLVLAVVLARTVHAWVRGDDRRRAERLLVLVVFGAFSIVSILYNPDFIHIGFTLPVFLILAAESVTDLLRRDRSGRAVGLVAAALAVASVIQLRTNLLQARAEFRFPVDTPFGRVDLATAHEVHVVDQIRRLLDVTPGRSIFFYPAWTAAYLLVDGRNPTRHDLISPEYQGADEVNGVIAALDRSWAPWVVVIRPFVHDDDPVLAYVRRHYRCNPEWICGRADGGRPRALDR